MKHSAGFVFALAASLAPSTFAHGFLASIAIDGQVYQGNIPNQGNASSPIRVIDDITPVKGAMNRDINCGKNALIAAVVAPANPGSVLSFDWHSGENTIWPHNIGPMMTYMAVCGNTTCDQFDAINAEWFKIDEAGQFANNLSVWHQQDLFEGKSVNVTLPQDIAPGDYLVRHEIIALHLGNELGGAEFYPSCSQIRISSNNGTVVQPNQTVSLPGAYNDTDPGIFVPTVGVFDFNNYAVGNSCDFHSLDFQPRPKLPIPWPSHL
ncbi:hypothetical protein Clacol_003236 [Clathrus columnatus]|uniref:lytic cellulose monooxygenase (C4-dehydrogenating) n=1 Tax=Clathrus columnatus TaxID=1419009 RepID=A0AAV5A427_9AGAM|nr:hypothetical protein Clacol_003236 [Clathrus columnatus]